MIEWKDGTGRVVPLMQLNPNRLFRFIPISVFVLAFSVYLCTLSPTVSFIDSGELTAVSYTLGIAHPTGYPIYTLLGRLFTLIPIGEVAWRLNLASSLFASLSAALLSFALFPLAGPLAATAVPVLFAFSPVLWGQAGQAEVYALTALLSTMLLCLGLKPRSRGREIFLFSFLFGLSLANHMTVLAVALPVGGYLLVEGKGFMRGRTVVTCLLLFLLGLSIYLYLPIRSRQSPILDWGDPENLRNFLRHVSGKQYRVWMFSSSFSAFREQALTFSRLLVQQFTPFLLPFSFLGIWAAFRRGKRVGLVLVSIFLLDLIYLNYDIPDLGPYFLPAFMVTALWTGGGMCEALRMLRDRLRLKGVLANAGRATAILACLITLLVVRYPRLSGGGDYVAYDFGVDVLRSIGRDGICITNNWDIYSPILYLRYIQGIRRDVVMVDKELLRRSWYFDYLRREYPWLIERSEKEIQSYLALLEDFEEGRLRDPGDIQKRFVAMINSFISRNLKDRPIYLTFVNGFDRDAADIAEGYSKIPWGLVYRVGSEPGLRSFDYKALSPRRGLDLSVPMEERVELNLSIYPRMTMERAMYEMRRGRLHEAINLLREGLKWNWRPTPFHRNLGMCYLRMGEYERASEEFVLVLRADPEDKMVREALAAIRKMRRSPNFQSDSMP